MLMLRTSVTQNGSTSDLTSAWPRRGSLMRTMSAGLRPCPASRLHSRSAAKGVGAHRRMVPLLLWNRCSAHSTNVIVFPVPGGPNSTCGAPAACPASTRHTSLCCSSFKLG